MNTAEEDLANALDALCHKGTSCSLEQAALVIRLLKRAGWSLRKIPSKKKPAV